MTDTLSRDNRTNGVMRARSGPVKCSEVTLLWHRANKVEYLTFFGCSVQGFVTLFGKVNKV